MFRMSRRLFTCSITLALLARAQNNTGSIPAIPNPVTGSGVLLADPGMFAALPFPFSRAGESSSSVLDITFPTNSSPITGYGGVSTVQAVQASLSALSNVSFIAWQPRFADMAKNASVQRLFANGDYHEALIYVPENHTVFLTGVGGDNQYVIDLNTLTLSNYTTSPPVENVNGGTYHDGKLYLATNGGPKGPAGIYSVDVTTGQASVVVNNYRGLSFNSPNDVVVDKSGNVWFTDPTYGYLNRLNPKPPQMATGVWFFNSTSQLVTLAVNDITEPNGLVLSPDETVMYVADSGGPNVVYAYDILNGRFLANKRVFYLSNTVIPDGTKVTQNGDFFTSSGGKGAGGYGLEIADSQGTPLGQVIVPVNNATINSTWANFCFVPSVKGSTTYDTIWGAGGDAIWRITGLDVTGVVL